MLKAILCSVNISYFKGKRSFGKKFFFFFSEARKYGEEIKIKKNKFKFLYFRPHKRLFGSEKKRAQWWRTECF